MPENSGKFYREQAWENIYRRFDAVDEEIKDIKENHLFHIYTRLGVLEKKMAYYAGGVVGASAIIQYLLR